MNALLQAIDQAEVAVLLEALEAGPDAERLVMKVVALIRQAVREVRLADEER